jgi:flagellar assembly protein FliH
MSSTVINKEQLTPFERWELASFDSRPPVDDVASIEEAVPPITVAEVEDIRQQAHDEGYAAGYAAGTQQAQNETVQIHTLLQGLQNELNQLDEDISQSLLDLSLEIARKMVSETLLVKPEVILKIVSAAISSLPHFNQNAHLILHPDDAELVRKHMGEQLSHAGWKIFTDPKLLRGGCRVETTHTHVDATTGERWKRIVRMLGQDKSWQA